MLGGINTYTYVGGNPVSRVDPLGLWSITFGRYIGVGGEVIFGRDSQSGNGFMTFRAGFGFGGGFQWQREGGRPGSEPCDSNKGGWSTGLFADWFNGNIGPLDAGLSSNRGRIFFGDGSSRDYNIHITPSWGLGDSWGIKGGGAFGAEWTIFSRAQP